MKNLELEKNEIERAFNKIEKITQRAKSNGNSSCFVFHFGNENFIVRSGIKTPLKTYCMFFRSGKSYEFIDKKNIPLQDIWVFIDLKRQNYYIVYEGKIIEIDFACILYAYGNEATDFSVGFYCYKDNCVILYDKDFARAAFNFVSNYYKEVTRQNNLTQKNTDKEEDFQL